MKSFLICHRGALGDFILTWPALNCLREILPDFQFLGVGRLEYMRLAVKLGLLDSCLDMESSRMLDFFSGKAIPPEISSPRGAALWLTQGQSVVRLIKKTASLPVVSIAPFPVKRMHVALHHCLAIQSHFPISIPEDLSHSFPPKPSRGEYILIHPGSGSPTKNYLPQFYLGLADYLKQSGYPNAGFIFGPVENEKLLAEDFEPEWIEQPGNVEELAELLAGAALYIGNDSGVSHLSGILGTPTVAFYKTTDPKIWGVLGRNVAHLPAANEEIAMRMIRERLSQIPLFEAD